MLGIETKVEPISIIFSRGHATLHLGVSVGMSVTNNSEFRAVLHYSSCPTVRDCIAVYPALFII